MHERDLLDVYHPAARNGSGDTVLDRNGGAAPEGCGELMDRADLFRLLGKGGHPSLSAYAVYAHLRSQSFVILRHIAGEGENGDDGPEDVFFHAEGKKRDRDYRWSIRTRTLSARPPSVLDPFSDATAAALPESSIAYDAYSPNSGFRKTNPGTPDFCVAICLFAAPSPQIGELASLLGRCADMDCAENNVRKEVPLRIAVVSDGGTVILFAVAEGQVPDVTGRVKKGRRF